MEPIAMRTRSKSAMYRELLRERTEIDKSHMKDRIEQYIGIRESLYDQATNILLDVKYRLSTKVIEKNVNLKHPVFRKYLTDQHMRNLDRGIVYSEEDWDLLEVAIESIRDDLSNHFLSRSLFVLSMKEYMKTCCGNLDLWHKYLGVLISGVWVVVAFNGYFYPRKWDHPFPDPRQLLGYGGKFVSLFGHDGINDRWKYYESDFFEQIICNVGGSVFDNDSLMKTMLNDHFTDFYFSLDERCVNEYEKKVLLSGTRETILPGFVQLFQYYRSKLRDMRVRLNFTTEYEYNMIVERRNLIDEKWKNDINGDVSGDDDDLLGGEKWLDFQERTNQFEKNAEIHVLYRRFIYDIGKLFISYLKTNPLPNQEQYEKACLVIFGFLQYGYPDSVPNEKLISIQEKMLDCLSIFLNKFQRFNDDENLEEITHIAENVYEMSFESPIGLAWSVKVDTPIDFDI